MVKTKPFGLVLARVPPWPLLLGWSGVVPFSGLSAIVVFTSDLHAMAGKSLVGYGAVILGFMGGVQWGLEMMRPQPASTSIAGYSRSVFPALLAFLAILCPVSAALWLLALGFAGLLVYDVQRVRQGVGPEWYATLRLQLSPAVIVALAGAAVATASSSA